MTSQKRYRHHQDNNAQRFRDLPPRFKRQKSVTSQSNPSQDPNPASPAVPRHCASPASQSLPVNSPAASAMTRKSDSASTHQGNISSRCNTPNLKSTSGQWPARGLTPPASKSVLSQVDNRKSKSPPLVSDFYQGPQSKPAVYSGHQVPVCAWPVVSQMPSIPPSHPALLTNPWAPISLDMFADQRVQSPPFVVYNNENYAPLAHSSPASPWSQASYSPYQSAAPSPSPSIQTSMAPSEPAFSALASPSCGSDEQSAPDMSDPDIRTIEMLKELERVADQKESEAEDFGSDRKTLVSHHLRMLMCAVDRYTEGIDGEAAEESRGEEAFSPSIPTSASSSSAQTKLPQESVSKKPNLQSHCPATLTPKWESPKPSKCVSVSPKPAGNIAPKPVAPSPPSVWSSTPAAPKPLLQPLSMTTAKSSETLSPMTPRTPEWNLWSSPGFEIFGVNNEPISTGQRLCPLDHMLYNPELGRAPDKRERRALYNR